MNAFAGSVNVEMGVARLALVISITGAFVAGRIAEGLKNTLCADLVVSASDAHGGVGVALLITRSACQAGRWEDRLAVA